MLAQEIRAGLVGNLTFAELFADTFEGAHSMRSGAAVVSVQHLYGLGERPDDKNLFGAGCERERAVVLQQRHRFTSDLEGQLTMRGAVDFRIRSLGIRNH